MDSKSILSWLENSHSANQASSSSSYSPCILKLKVGPDNNARSKIFEVDHDNLIAYSDYFEIETTQANFDNNQIFELPDLDPAIFEYVVHFIYHSNYRISSNEIPDDEEKSEILIHANVFFVATRLRIMSLRKLSIAKITDIVNENQESQSSFDRMLKYGLVDALRIICMNSNAPGRKRLEMDYLIMVLLDGITAFPDSDLRFLEELREHEDFRREMDSAKAQSP